MEPEVELDIKCLNGQQQRRLIESAEQTALRFCAPVYLVGSAINNLYPNDIDIFIAVKGETYLRLFTNYNKKTESQTDHLQNMKDMQIQQARIYRKQKEYFESQIKGWDFDVKFQVIDSFIQHTGERIRLDTVYSDLW